jgi:hypothetical protein
MRQRERADEETELAFELLDAASPAELDRAVGHLVSAAAGRADRPLGPGTITAMHRLITEAAQSALPIVASVAAGGGAWTAGPAGNAANGSRAGRLMGLELEGLSPEDQELELARQFVRVAVTTGEQAARRHARGPAGLFGTEHQWKEEQ